MERVIDYKQRLLDEIEGLPSEELEKIYKMVVLVRDEFIDLSGEERYVTESWIKAEREATEAYGKGGLPRFSSVADLAAHVEAIVEVAGHDAAPDGA
jgi:hypothetical protein